MTEAEWLACTEPGLLLEFLRHKVSARKLRLFACSWCRQVWKELHHEDSRNAIEITEQYADGLVEKEGFGRARYAAQEVMFAGVPLAWKAAWIASWADAWDAATEVSRWAEWDWLGDSEADRLLEKQAAVLRCIVDNPFRDARRELGWLTPTVTALAYAAYDQRQLPSGALESVRLAVLSDALEDAGCTDAELLAHLRSPGPHVRGCWALDLITGKQ